MGNGRGYVLAHARQEGRGPPFDDDDGDHTSPPAGAATVADLQVVELGLERLDRAVRHLEVLVETVALGDELRSSSVSHITRAGRETYVLLPRPEVGLVRLDLLGEAAAQRLLLLFEFRVLELAGLLLAKLAYLHLSLPVVLVVHFLRRRDEVEHVRADEERAELAEVAVVLALDCFSARE